MLYTNSPTEIFACHFSCLGCYRSLDPKGRKNICLDYNKAKKRKPSFSIVNTATGGKMVNFTSLEEKKRKKKKKMTRIQWRNKNGKLGKVVRFPFQ